jgi:Undecaprenyl-phosphate galactose phosphotransferase WbaP
MPGLPSAKLTALVERVGGVFSHLLVIPDLFGLATLGVPAREVDGILGLEVRQQLLLPGPRLAKRVMDVALTALGGLFLLPIFVLLAALIRIDSPGPIFYAQDRLGRDGRRFRALKFRTMHGDGEARLQAVLAADARLAAEYAEFHKLSRDPRVTRVGRLLRKYSLDELPQLWSVLTGDMSLVGPRPYLEREVAQMNGREGVILRALPGMTGLWQVGDRNATRFEERTATDVHYVRNWSPWLDVWVLARTLGVVLGGTGS